MPDPQIVAKIRRKFDRLKSSFNERTRRHWAATEALALRPGGISAVAAATGLSRVTIRAGIAELKSPQRRSLPPGRAVRHQGGGRPRVISRDPGLRPALENLITGRSRRKSREPLVWTVDSSRVLARKLARQKYRASYRTVAALLHRAGYSLRSKRPSPDRAVEFKSLSERVRGFLEQRQPVIFVGLKSKRADSRKGLQDSRGWISARIGQDTAGFALRAIRRWWNKEKTRFRTVRKVLVVMEGGGVDRVAELKLTAGLEELGQRMGLSTELRWLPRGTCRWRDSEQRLLSFTLDKRPRIGPVVGWQAVVDLIGRPGKQTR